MHIDAFCRNGMGKVLTRSSRVTFFLSSRLSRTIGRVLVVTVVDVDVSLRNRHRSHCEFLPELDFYIGLMQSRGMQGLRRHSFVDVIFES